MNKKSNIEKHKLIILLLMLQEVSEDMQEANQITPYFKNIIDKINELGVLSKELIEKLNDMKSITSTTYIQEITNKIDTIFRKNYQVIN